VASVPGPTLSVSYDSIGKKERVADRLQLSLTCVASADKTSDATKLSWCCALIGPKTALTLSGSRMTGSGLAPSRFPAVRSGGGAHTHRHTVTSLCSLTSTNPRPTDLRTQDSGVKPGRGKQSQSPARFVVCWIATLESHDPVASPVSALLVNKKCVM
jgi:hypothetical protein